MISISSVLFVSTVLLCVVMLYIQLIAAL